MLRTLTSRVPHLLRELDTNWPGKMLVRVRSQNETHTGDPTVVSRHTDTQASL